MDRKKNFFLQVFVQLKKFIVTSKSILKNHIKKFDIILIAYIKQSAFNAKKLK